jgi:carbonic anhydrase
MVAIMNERRAFLRVAGIGGLATLAGATLTFRHAVAAGQAEALLLSCMDYRLIDATARYMAARGLKGKYDHVILAGASLGATTGKYVDWNKTFWEHLDTAIQLHGIHRVIVIDHRDCGAYKLILGEDLAGDRSKETTVHASTLRTLRDQINTKHRSLEVELLLMSLDGRVDVING